MTLKPSDFLTDVRQLIDQEKDFKYFADRYPDARRFVDLMAALMADVIAGSTPESQEKFWLNLARGGDKTARLTTLLRKAGNTEDPRESYDYLRSLSRHEFAGTFALLAIVMKAHRAALGLDDPALLAECDRQQAEYDAQQESA